MAVDAANGAAMQALVAALRQRHGRIAGVVHAALTLANAPVAAMTDAEFTAALAPKVAGSLWLAEAFAAEPPDHVALFSSSIALSGGAGQANYAAAAGFQDAFGHWLADRIDCPVRVIDWGFWNDVGSVAHPSERARLTRLGMGGIGTAEGLALFDRVLAAPYQRLAVARLLPDAVLPRAEPAAPPGPIAAPRAPARTAVRDWLRGSSPGSSAARPKLFRRPSRSSCSAWTA